MILNFNQIYISCDNFTLQKEEKKICFLNILPIGMHVIFAFFLHPHTVLS